VVSVELDGNGNWHFVTSSNPPQQVFNQNYLYKGVKDKLWMLLETLFEKQGHMTPVIAARSALLDETQNENRPATSKYFCRALQALHKHLEAKTTKSKEEAILWRSLFEPNSYGKTKNDEHRKKIMVEFITSSLELCSSGSEQHMKHCVIGLIDFFHKQILHHSKFSHHTKIRKRGPSEQFNDKWIESVQKLIPRQHCPSQSFLAEEFSSLDFTEAKLWYSRYVIGELVMKHVFGLGTFLDGYLTQRFALERATAYHGEEVVILGKNRKPIKHFNGEPVIEKTIIPFCQEFVNKNLHKVLKKFWSMDPLVKYGDYDDAHNWVHPQSKSKSELGAFFTELYGEGYFLDCIGDAPWEDIEMPLDQQLETVPEAEESFSADEISFERVTIRAYILFNDLLFACLQDGIERELGTVKSVIPGILKMTFILKPFDESGVMMVQVSPFIECVHAMLDADVFRIVSLEEKYSKAVEGIQRLEEVYALIVRESFEQSSDKSREKCQSTNAPSHAAPIERPNDFSRERSAEHQATEALRDDACCKSNKNASNGLLNGEKSTDISLDDVRSDPPTQALEENVDGSQPSDFHEEETTEQKMLRTRFSTISRTSRRTKRRMEAFKSSYRESKSVTVC
jgi:hypothetical protein